MYFSDKEAASRENVSSGSIELSLHGANNLIFNLPIFNLGFSVEPEDISLPGITNLSSSHKDRTTNTITIITNDICAIYYMNALEGT